MNSWTERWSSRRIAVALLGQPGRGCAGSCRLHRSALRHPCCAALTAVQSKSFWNTRDQNQAMTLREKVPLTYSVLGRSKKVVVLV